MTAYETKRHAARVWRCVQDKRTRRHYQRQWLRAINILGDRWVLAQQSTFAGDWGWKAHG